MYRKFSFILAVDITTNMCSGITVEVHLKNCNLEKLQFFTVDLCSPQIREQMSGPKFSQNVKSILGCGPLVWAGL